jgi:hypothetical protein
VQTLLWAPYLCQACGGLALVWLDTGRLVAIGPEHEAYLCAHAPILWDAITAARQAMSPDDNHRPE